MHYLEKYNNSTTRPTCNKLESVILSGSKIHWCSQVVSMYLHCMHHVLFQPCCVGYHGHIYVITSVILVEITVHNYF